MSHNPSPNPAGRNLAKASGSQERSARAVDLTGASGSAGLGPTLTAAFTFPDEPVPDRWQRIHSRDELEAFYRHILPRVREAARKCGYALGLHGSMRRDLDLIAAPWATDHTDRDKLAHCIAMAACGIAAERYEWKEGEKPCGRVAVSIPVCWPEGDEFPRDEKSTGHIDLSVMPAITVGHHQGS